MNFKLGEKICFKYKWFERKKVIAVINKVFEPYYEFEDNDIVYDVFVIESSDHRIQVGSTIRITGKCLKKIN